MTLRQAYSSPTNSMGSADLWTSERLALEIPRLFGDSRLCVIANREPWIHNRLGRTIEVVSPASGLVTAVEPIVRACRGLWIGHGSGSADRETSDKRGMLRVPPEDPQYSLKRVWLSSQEEQGYYFGFANEGLWPLCHIVHTRPTFRTEDWKYYCAVNDKFAEAFAEEMVGDKPIALVQDYHFTLLPQRIRKLKPQAVVGLFWHIPWSSPDVMRICPWITELITGMLGSDLIGFQTQYHCNNFLDCVDRFLEARVDRENFSVTMQGHTCYVKPFPISIECPPKNDVSQSEIVAIRARVFDELGIPSESFLGIGVDRIDYTKGIVERLLSIERLLEKHPELVGRFTFVQVGSPSRTSLKKYRDVNWEIRELADRVNLRFRQPGYEPIHLRFFHHDASAIFRFYRAADVCVVNSLHDGMNLVAKEFIASRSDNRGALVLSSFTGAARELTDALVINPYDIEETSDAIYRALSMENTEREERMARMRRHITANNVYHWAHRYLSEIHRISEKRGLESRYYESA